MFARPSGSNLDRMLTNLPGQSTLGTYDKVKKALDVKIKNFDLVDKERFHNACVEFQYFVKKVLSQMKTLKQAI